MSKKRHRITADQATAGRRLAIQLHKDERLNYKERKRRICDVISCSESAAEKWMAEAIIAVLEEVSDIIPGDPAASRWKRVQIYDGRARRWRNNADRRVEAGKYGDAHRCEALAVQYEHLIAKVCHWDKLAPEQDLDDPKLRQTVIGIITRKLGVFTSAELLDMYRALNSELADRQRTPELAPLDMARLAQRAREEQDRTNAMGDEGEDEEVLSQGARLAGNI